MNWSRSKHDRGRLRAVRSGLVLVAAGASLSACGAPPAETAGYDEPASLEPIKGTDVQRVRFSAEGARQVGLRTDTVRDEDGKKTIPFAAVLYDAEGNTFAYTSPDRLTYVREAIEVDRVDDSFAVLSDGPPAGTEVVTVGAAEVYGTEFEVAH